jgi:hypothetical protein
MANIVLKIGDSIIWNLQYKQSNGTTPVDLTGFKIDIDAISKADSSMVLFNVDTDNPTANMYIDTSDKVNGNFKLIIKDTQTFVKGDYLVDIEYTSADGYKSSSKSFGLKVQERL